MGEEQIDRASGVQPYRQLAGILRRQIEGGTRAGALPSEKQLAAQFGVSPASTRKALATLREAGLIETIPGWGSYVVPPEDRKQH